MAALSQSVGQNTGKNMNQQERFHKILTILSQRKSASTAHLLTALDVSPATLKRDLTYLRDRLGSPIEWSRAVGGYRLSGDAPLQARHELAGLWFSATEIHALLTMHQLLERLDGGALIGPHVAPLMDRLNALLGRATQAARQTRATGATGASNPATLPNALVAGTAGHDPVQSKAFHESFNAAEQVRRRVRIIGLAQRGGQPTHFQTVGSALLQRKRLALTYIARGTGETTQREVSPLRLVHYRENWHLDAWCHLRKGLRNFAVDAIQAARTLAIPAREVSDEKLDATFDPSYGIFSGGRLRWAYLRFTPERAAWVADEHWHPKQQGAFVADGHYDLRIPYTDYRELLMDILKHGAHCEVLAPASLRRLVLQEVGAMTKKYFRDNG